MRRYCHCDKVRSWVCAVLLACQLYFGTLSVHSNAAWALTPLASCWQATCQEFLHCHCSLLMPLKECMLSYFAVLDSRWMSGNFTLLLIPSISLQNNT